jgi:hypothetical protein
MNHSKNNHQFHEHFNTSSMSAQKFALNEKQHNPQFMHFIRMQNQYQTSLSCADFIHKSMLCWTFLLSFFFNKNKVEFEKAVQIRPRIVRAQAAKTI